jgi:hypothetical protein
VSAGPPGLQVICCGDGRWRIEYDLPACEETIEAAKSGIAAALDGLPDEVPEGHRQAPEAWHLGYRQVRISLGLREEFKKLRRVPALTTRIEHIVKNSGLSLKEFAAQSDRHLLTKIPNFGRKCFEIIREAYPGRSEADRRFLDEYSDAELRAELERRGHR